MEAVDREQLNKTTEKVNELHAMMVLNGFAGAVKQTQKDLTELNERFDNYMKDERPATCYFLQHQEKLKEGKDKTLKRMTIYFGLLLSAFKVFDYVAKWQGWF